MSTSYGITNNVQKIFAVGVTFNPANIAAAGTSEQTVTITGLLTGDIVLAINKPTHTSTFGVVGARVSAANTLAVTLIATAAIDAPSETWIFVIGRPDATLPAVVE
jgi:hypothetical protein